MTSPGNDPSIEHEPHFRRENFDPDSTESKARRIVENDTERETEDDRVEHTVWDEPALSHDLAGQPPTDALTYARWFESRQADTSVGRSWLTALGIALLAGPWAIFGSLIGRGETAFGIAMVVVLGPVLEEIMKVAGALWIVEKRPFLFRTKLQIVLCVLTSGFVFAAVENVLYLYVYVAEPSRSLVLWRWTVCVALHMGCSMIAGLGLMRIWEHTITTRSKPQLPLGASFMITAIVVHGLYNSFAVLLAALDFQF